MNKIFLKFQHYAESKSLKFHTLFTIFSLILFAGIIVFGFAPTSLEIEQSGYSTGDLQSASSQQDVNTILTAWEPVMTAIIRLSILDYFFIIAGFLLFFSLNSILVVKFATSEKLRNIPLMGMSLTLLSRSLDSLENLWAILIYGNADNYSPSLIPLLNYTEQFKWIIVVLEYSILASGWFVYFYLKISHRILKEN
ncbi:MAG: hypothetical protein ACTSYI_05295 [Promethearchaeota archaeon]